MKKLAIILIIFAFSTTVKATIGFSYLVEQENIRINVSVDCTGCPFLPLYYSGMVEILNAYIREKIANGKLENKRFEVQVNAHNHLQLQLTQGRNGYFVTIALEYASLENMRAIIHYFANSNWRPVLLPYWGDVSYRESRLRRLREIDFDDVHRKILRFFEQNAASKPFEFEPVTVWERDGVSIEFSSDGLRYLINGKLLALRPEDHMGRTGSRSKVLPIRIRDRFLFFQRDGIHVKEDMETIQFLEWKDMDVWRVRETAVHSKWVNIGGWPGWSISYSYEQNRFFNVEVKWSEEDEMELSRDRRLRWDNERRRGITRIH